MRKRIFAILLTAVMLLGMMPMAASATEVENPDNVGLCYLPLMGNNGQFAPDSNVTKYMQNDLHIIVGANHGYLLALYDFDGTNVTEVTSGVEVSNGFILDRVSEFYHGLQCPDNWYLLRSSVVGNGSLSVGGKTLPLIGEEPDFGLYADQSCTQLLFLPELTGTSTTMYLGMDAYGQAQRTITSVRLLDPADGQVLDGVRVVIAGDGKTAEITFGSNFLPGRSSFRMEIEMDNTSNGHERWGQYVDFVDKRPALVAKYLGWNDLTGGWGEPQDPVLNYIKLTSRRLGSGSNAVALFFKDGNGDLTPVDATTVPTLSGLNVYPMNGVGHYELSAQCFGTDKFTYVDNGVTYELPVNIGLPYIGFYSDQSATEQTYLEISGFNLTKTDKTFYVNALDSSWIIDVVEKFNSNDPINISKVSDQCYKVEFTDAYNGQTWVNVHVDAHHVNSGSRWDTGMGMPVIDGRPGLVFKYLNYDGNNGTWSAPDPDWDAQKFLNVSPKLNGDQITGIAVFLQDGNTLTPVNVRSAGGNAIRLKEISGHTGWYEVSATDFGDVGVSYTDGSTTYSTRIYATLPEVGIYSRADAWTGNTSSSNLAFNSYLELKGFTVTKTSDTFYICVRNGAPAPASVSQKGGSFTNITKVNNRAWKVQITDAYDGTDDIANFLVDYGDAQNDVWIHLFDGRAGGLQWDHVLPDQNGNPDRPAGQPSFQPIEMRMGFGYLVLLTYNDGATSTVVTDATADGNCFDLIAIGGNPGWYLVQPERVGEGSIKATVGGKEFSLKVVVDKATYDVSVGQDVIGKNGMGRYMVTRSLTGPTTVTLKNNYAQDDPFNGLGVNDLSNPGSSITVNGCTVAIDDDETITVTVPAGRGDLELNFWVGAGSYGDHVQMYIQSAPAVASLPAGTEPTTHTEFTYNNTTYYYGISKMIFEDAQYAHADPYCGGMFWVDARYGRAEFYVAHDFYTKNAAGEYVPVSKATRETLLAACQGLSFEVQATESGYAHGPMVVDLGAMINDYPDAKAVVFLDQSTVGAWAVIANGTLPDGTALSDVFVGMMEQRPFVIPVEPASRGHVLTLLWNLAGQPSHSRDVDFSDLCGYEESYNAICWAYENRIANGFEDGTFHPDYYMTRAELAKLVATYKNADIANYTPSTDIKLADIGSDHWAYKYVCWVYENEYMGAINAAGTQFGADNRVTVPEIAALCESLGSGHDWEEVEVVKEPTETKPGTMDYVCKICLCHDQQDSIPPLGCELSKSLFTVSTAAVTYTGEAITKDITSVIDEEYYEVAYSDNTNAGTATITITAKAPFTGSVSYEFTINKAKVTGTPTFQTVSGEGKTLEDVTLGMGTLKPEGGQLVWEADKDTKIQANQSYTWVYTPTDVTNYEVRRGSAILYPVYAPPASSESGSSTPTGTTTSETDPDTGTVTETTSYSDGATAVVTTTADGVTAVEATVPSSAVAAAAASGEAVKVSMPPVQAGETAETAPTVTVKLPSYTAAAKVEVPVEDVTPGTVAILVKPDGTEEIIKTSVVTDDGVAMSVENGATIKIVDNSKTFADVSSNDWYADSVAFASSHELFNGTGATTFSPANSMTRGMLATVLYRLEYEPEAAANTFADVDSNAYYAAGIAWAAEHKIVSGYGDSFGPEDNITREQLVTMLWRYAGQPSANAGLHDFSDTDSVSEYAVGAMQWAVKEGIVSGKGNGVLDPLGNATRAEVAAIFQRLVKLLMK